MTVPRPVFPGQFLMITRRCTQQEFLLRPDKETNENYAYCLAEAASRFDITVILSQMEPNHHHTTVWDPHGNQVAFREHFHKLLAKSQNALRGRWENLWAAVEPSVVVIPLEDLLEKLVYVATNPVKDNLVEEVCQWPGPKFVQALLSGKPIKAKRPWWFFSKNGTMPPEVELMLKLPDNFESKDEFLATLRRRIAEVEEQYRVERRKSGLRVMGRARVLRQRWNTRPAKPAPRRGLNPRVAGRDKWLRIKRLQDNAEWLSDYREARRAMRANEPYAFPYGTYWLGRFTNVVVKPAPSSDAIA